MQPLLLLNTIGLTARLLPQAPRLHALAQASWQRPLREVVPAVTCTAQATLLTGQTAEGHGIVGNGWLYRETGEIRFWQQSNRLIQSEPLYRTARVRAAERGRTFRCAKLFWWFNQGAGVDLSVTPKPHYGSDGNKLFDILSTPAELASRLKAKLGAFPFHTFWGPTAGLPCTEWIARCSAEVLREHRPDLTLVYLPHLDYDTQRLGPEHCDWPRLLRELDGACAPLLDIAREVGARVWVVNEYTHLQVSRAVEPNRMLRR
ncbi:MAG: alkaline phosphatase family protein, partial [Gemmataceae bacterium]|nr:alkaline phosphatase family protein [Gemmataceae bacterium]